MRAGESACEDFKCKECNMIEIPVDVWMQKGDTIEQLKKELEEARKIISDLEDENKVLKEILREEEVGSTNSWATVAKNGHKKAGTKDKTNSSRNSGSVRIVGDSMLRYSAEGCREQGAIVECLPGIRIEQLTRRISNMAQNEQDEVVLLNVGTNNIKSARSSDHLMGEIWDLGMAARRTFTRAKIIVAGVMRRKDTPIAFIDAVNRNLDWACERMGLGFFDPNCWLGWSDLGRDGVHLNRQGSFKMGELLCNVVRHFRNQEN